MKLLKFNCLLCFQKRILWARSTTAIMFSYSFAKQLWSIWTVAKRSTPEWQESAKKTLVGSISSTIIGQLIWKLVSTAASQESFRSTLTKFVRKKYILCTTGWILETFKCLIAMYQFAESVYQMPDDKTKFYAAFTTGSSDGLIGSAICSYSLSNIQEAFAGKFKEQATSSSAWLPVLTNKVPNPRPGTCINDTTALPDSVLNFIRYMSIKQCLK